MAINRRQFDKYSIDRSSRARVPYFFPFGTSVSLAGATACNGFLLPQQTSTTFIPASTSAAGAAVSVTPTHATNIFTAGSAHGFGNGQVLRVAGVAVPTGLAAATDYYVINKTSTTFQLAATLNGPALDFTDDGNTVTVNIPAGSPWLIYSGEALTLPTVMTVLAAYTDAAFGSAVVMTVKIRGKDWYGNLLPTETVTVTTADTTATGVQSANVYRSITYLAVESCTNTAAGDKVSFGYSNGLNSTVATYTPRAWFGLPQRKRDTSALQGVWLGAAGTATIAGYLPASALTFHSSLPAFKLPADATGDLVASCAGWGVLLYDEGFIE